MQTPLHIPESATSTPQEQAQQLEAILKQLSDYSPNWMQHLQGLANTATFNPKLYAAGLKLLKLPA